MKNSAFSSPRVLSYKPRRPVGISRTDSGGAPLTKINGRDYPPKLGSDTHKKVTAAVKPSPTMRKDTDAAKLDDILLPPLSSSDEAENNRQRRAASSDIFDSDEEYDKRRTANIKKTEFSRAKSDYPGVFPIPNEKGIRAPRVSHRKYNTGNSYGSAGSKRTAEEDRPRAVTQLEREIEQRKVTKQPPRKKKKPVGYGTKSSATWARPTSSAGQDKDQTPPRKSLGSPWSSPFDSPPKKPKSRPLSPGDVDGVAADKPGSKNLPLRTSPRSTSRKGGSRSFSISSISSLSDFDKGLPALGGKAKRPIPRKATSKQAASKRSKPSPEPEEPKEKPIYQILRLEDLGPFSKAISPQKAAAIAKNTEDSFWDDDDVWDDSDLEQFKPSKSKCPLCGQVVDSELLEKHTPAGPMSIKQQTQFCALHKRQSAMDLGRQRGYPEIDWDKLDMRCSAYQKYLGDILQGNAESHYRQVYKENVNSVKNRTTLQNRATLTPGYYGPRGVVVMTDFIIRKLSPLIRKRAVEDRLIAARSSMGYIQGVLVPELAVRLIMEDMSVNESRARGIMEESAELGQLLHDETKDVVTTKEEEEAEDHIIGFGTDEDEVEHSTDEDELAYL
ncbi:RTC4-like domain-containing protein [Poronia punctata]|nr:RTC4-like domain-containing protein [Poronia punctata]